MARAYFSKAVIRRVSGAPADGTVSVYKTGTNVPLDQPVYAADTGSTVLADPFPFTNGLVEFYLEQPERVRLAITPTGSPTQTFDNVDVLSVDVFRANRKLALITPGALVSDVRTSVVPVNYGSAGAVVVLAKPAVGALARVIRTISVINGSNGAVTLHVRLNNIRIAELVVPNPDTASVELIVPVGPGDTLDVAVVSGGGVNVQYSYTDEPVGAVDRSTLSASGGAAAQTLFTAPAGGMVVGAVYLTTGASGVGSRVELYLNGNTAVIANVDAGGVAVWTPQLHLPGGSSLTLAVPSGQDGVQALGIATSDPALV